MEYIKNRNYYVDQSLLNYNVITTQEKIIKNRGTCSFNNPNYNGFNTKNFTSQIVIKASQYLRIVNMNIDKMPGNATAISVFFGNEFIYVPLKFSISLKFEHETLLKSIWLFSFYFLFGLLSITT